MSLFTWIESTAIARSVGQSLWITAGLSATHILAFTLVMGAAMLVNLRLLGALLAQHPVADITRPATRAIALGLVISIGTGFLLFSSRAVSVVEGSTFRAKMFLLVSAVIFHFAIQGRITRRARSEAPLLKMSGAAGLLLWLGLAVAACWFILFE